MGLYSNHSKSLFRLHIHFLVTEDPHCSYNDENGDAKISVNVEIRFKGTEVVVVSGSCRLSALWTYLIE